MPCGACCGVAAAGTGLPLSALMGCRCLGWLGAGRLDGRPWLMDAPGGWPARPRRAARPGGPELARRRHAVLPLAWGLQARLTATVGATLGAAEKVLLPLPCRALRCRREACAGLRLSIAAPAAKRLWADPRAPGCGSDRCPGCLAHRSVAHRSAGAERRCCGSSHAPGAPGTEPGGRSCRSRLRQKPRLPGPVGGASAAGGAGERRRPGAAAQRRRSSRSF